MDGRDIKQRLEIDSYLRIIEDIHSKSSKYFDISLFQESLVEFTKPFEDYINSFRKSESVNLVYLSKKFEFMYRNYGYHFKLVSEDPIQYELWFTGKDERFFRCQITGDVVQEILRELDLHLLQVHCLIEDKCFELISVGKTRELDITQIQLNLLFHSLIKNNIVTDKIKDVASGLTAMTGLGFNFFNQNLNNPLGENKDNPPKEADFSKVIRTLKKSIEYLEHLKTENEIK